MEHEIFSLADYAADYGNGKMLVAGTFDTLFTPQLPAVHPSCSIAIRLRVANSEAGAHDFEIRVLTPDKQQLHSIKGRGEIRANPNADYTSMNIVMNLNNLKLEKAGKYAIEFYFDNEFRSGLSLHVIPGMPAGMVKAA
jgi:hypothetical protein